MFLWCCIPNIFTVLVLYRRLSDTMLNSAW